MANLNRVILAGNLTRDPQLSYTPSNTAVCKFGMAINRSWTDRSTGDRRDETTFVDLTAFGRQAEVINQYLRKGRGVLVEGRLNYSQWTNPEGQKRSKLEVVVENFQFLGGRPDGASGGRSAPAREGARTTEPDENWSDDAAPPGPDQDIPF
jgi:single-strand DNA-binding protein